MDDILEFIDQEQDKSDRLKMHGNNLNLFFQSLVWEIVDDVLYGHVDRSLRKYFLYHEEHPEIFLDYKNGIMKTTIELGYGKLEFILGRGVN